jgi:peptide/nickel transport system ATP-binding protein
MSADTLLDIQNLQVAYPDRTGGWNTVVRGVNLRLGRERLAIVGESGSGKSQTGRAILGLCAAGARIQADRLQFSDIDLLAASQRQRRELRGGRMAMILQDPKFSLNPVMRVGQQITETVHAHQKCSAAQARSAALDMLSAVAIDQPERVFNLYPHEISGGMGQRVMIAMMLVTGPELLIADEPTSALDVTVQLEVLRILDNLVRSRGMGLIFISHDLRLVSTFCDRVLVMYAGRVVEEIAANRLHEAKHPYTQGLLNCIPRLGISRHPLPTLQRESAWSQ